MGFIAILLVAAIGAIALIATIIASYVETSRSMKRALAACWAACALGVALFLIDQELCGRWTERGRWNSPDGRCLAVIETEFHPFYFSYEVSFRLTIRESSGNRVILRTEESDDAVAQHLWDRPAVNFRWDADSKGGW